MVNKHTVCRLQCLQPHNPVLTLCPHPCPTLHWSCTLSLALAKGGGGLHIQELEKTSIRYELYNTAPFRPPSPPPPPPPHDDIRHNTGPTQHK